MSKLKKIIESIVEQKLNEVDYNSMSSGFIRSKDSIDVVKNATSGDDIINAGKAGNFKAIKRIKSLDLKPGDIFLGSYNRYNQGAEIYEFIGITDDSTKYGKQFEKDGKPAFKTVKECLMHYNVTSLKALEELHDKNEYGYHSYMCVKDLVDGDSGPWFYLFNGRWSRGSGAEPLSFTLLQKV